VTRPENGGEEPQEPVTITDKRRIDPETGEKREGVSASAPEGSAPEAPAAAASDEAAEATADEPIGADAPVPRPSDPPESYDPPDGDPALD